MKKYALASRHTLAELIDAKNKSSDDGQKLRLRAIINIKKGKRIKQISEELLVSRRSISTWRHIYNERGIAGLVSHRGGRPEGNPKWDAGIFDTLGDTITKTGGYWSLPTMQEWIRNEYHETIPQQTIWYHLVEILKFSYKSARPHPYKGDRALQEAFKKGVSLKHLAQ